MSEVVISLKSRWYQRPLIDHFRNGGTKAFCCWARKSGKDRVATFIESELACKRPGLYWHALPKYEDARKVIWDAITPDGKRLIDVNFPREIVKKRLDHEMKIELVTGSIWQPVGVDNYDSLVGAFPTHITWSEYAIMSPSVRSFLRPALAMNKGTELVITTPRGYNHAYDLWNYAKDSREWYTSLVTAKDAGAIPAEALEEERRTMPPELFAQEYECSWSSANVGAILGRAVEQAEKDGRITDDVEYDKDGAEIVISSDIGRRHISAWWFWQPQVDGFTLVDYDEGAGLDAEEWIERLQARLAERGMRLGTIFLPHDAKAKTFAARNSPVEQFLRAFGHDKVKISPQTKKNHSIEAGQAVMRKARFHKTRCAAGLAALRAWQYEYDEDRKQYSKNPLDDWSCDASDAFCEGAKMLRARVMPEKEVTPAQIIHRFVEDKPTLDELWEEHEMRVNAERAY